MTVDTVKQVRSSRWPGAFARRDRFARAANRDQGEPTGPPPKEKKILPSVPVSRGITRPRPVGSPTDAVASSRASDVVIKRGGDDDDRKKKSEVARIRIRPLSAFAVRRFSAARTGRTPSGFRFFSGRSSARLGRAKRPVFRAPFTTWSRRSPAGPQPVGMEPWKRVTGMVTVIAFAIQIRPMDSFLTVYLTGPRVGVTLDEVTPTTPRGRATNAWLTFTWGWVLTLAKRKTSEKLRFTCNVFLGYSHDCVFESHVCTIYFLFRFCSFHGDSIFYIFRCRFQ